MKRRPTRLLASCGGCWRFLPRQAPSLSRVQAHTHTACAYFLKINKRKRLRNRVNWVLTTNDKRAASKGVKEVGSHKKNKPSKQTKKTLQAQQSTIRRDLQNTVLFPKKQGLCAPHRAPQSLHPAQSRTPILLALKTSGNYRGKPQNLGKWEPLFKGPMQLSHQNAAQKPLWKAPRGYVKETHLLILKCLWERRELVETLPQQRH